MSSTFMLPQTVHVWILRAVWPATSKVLRVEAETLEDAKEQAMSECLRGDGGSKLLTIDYMDMRSETRSVSSYLIQRHKTRDEPLRVKSRGHRNASTS